MPLFEYACPKCGHVFEKLVFNRSQEPPACPQCGASRTEQKFSTFATSAAPGSTRATCAPAGGG